MVLQRCYFTSTLLYRGLCGRIVSSSRRTELTSRRNSVKHKTPRRCSFKNTDPRARPLLAFSQEPRRKRGSDGGHNSRPALDSRQPFKFILDLRHWAGLLPVKALTGLKFDGSVSRLLLHAGVRDGSRRLAGAGSRIPRGGPTAGATIINTFTSESSRGWVPRPGGYRLSNPKDTAFSCDDGGGQG